MDRERVIELVEAEIRRRRAIAEINDFDAKGHLDVSEALRIVLEVYQGPGKETIPS